MKIGAVIRNVRKLKNVKQKDLAQQAGLAIPVLSKIEKGRREPNMEHLRKIALAMEMPVQILILLTLEESEVAEEKRAAFQKIFYDLQDLFFEDM